VVIAQIVRRVLRVHLAERRGLETAGVGRRERIRRRRRRPSTTLS